MDARSGPCQPGAGPCGAHAQDLPDGERFERIGFVRAWRLTDEFWWVTQRGDRLRGAPGDWLVTSVGVGDDRDSSPRTVAPEAFEATHAPAGGALYRRTGVVRAREAEREELVATLEGPATARPGDWIVTDAAGNRWPVPAAEFAKTYRPGAPGL